ncbi:hypothetical protein M988_3550 [Hafnia paralvei ATCC 29927]|nr:hypothetical protein M988_3550 [Hafnia paralvei ATCC 29927]
MSILTVTELKETSLTYKSYLLGLLCLEMLISPHQGTAKKE